MSKLDLHLSKIPKFVLFRLLSRIDRLVHFAKTTRKIIKAIRLAPPAPKALQGTTA
jgi:hypothetical protein